MLSKKQKMISEMTPEAKTECRRHQLRVNIGLVIAGLFLTAGALMPYVYIQTYSSLGFQFGTLEAWLMKSGATMSALALIGEVISLYARSESDIDRKGFIWEPYGPEMVREASRLPVKIITSSVIVLAFTGLAINSHGDMLHVNSDRWIWLAPFWIMLILFITTVAVLWKKRIFASL